MMNAHSRSSFSFLQIGVLALGLFAIGGCKAPPYPECKKDKHCRQELGETCVDGTCQNCKTDADCQDKGSLTKCHEFLCKDPNDPSITGSSGGGEGVGDPCTQSFDCIQGLVCKAGSCQPCSENFDCQPGTCNLGTGRCESAGAGGGSCTSDDQCQIDEICDNGTCVFSDVAPQGTDPCNLEAVFFDFDSPKLSSEVQDQLRNVAECFKSQGDRQVILEAHADRRGTEEYNILLTDRRGQSVKEFLTNLGVESGRLQVVSKGSLEATGDSESEMAKDRRVQFVWQ